MTFRDASPRKRRGRATRRRRAGLPGRKLPPRVAIGFDGAERGGSVASGLRRVRRGCPSAAAAMAARRMKSLLRT